jgi:hypothetical protein
MAERYDGIDLKPGTDHHEQVEALQRDLSTLGFAIAGEADGIFGLGAFWAVREFQAYAAMAQVAEEAAPGETVYADRLGPVATGAARYDGPVSGVVNAKTREAIGHWLDNRWRCPVVVEAWQVRNQRRHRIEAQNLWRHDDLPSKAPRMYARDLSGHFAPVAAGDDDRIVLGDYATYLSWSGPRSVPPNHTVPDGEMLPDALVGAPLEDLGAAQLSTFKVVRAVSEVECIGFFDSVNCYDNAFVSVGPCHWTLGIASPGGNVSEGEMCGFLAYLRHADAAAFDQAMGHFGARVDEDWVDAGGVPSGARLFNRAQRKYTGWVALQREDGGYTRMPEREKEGDFLKTWHWFYRFVMAGRTVAGYRRRMWDMARVRLRDLAEVPWGDGDATIADIFTSEMARAIILRWHIRFPAHVASGGAAGGRLRGALDRAKATAPGLDWAGVPAGWTDAHESALIAGLRAQTAGAGGGLDRTIRQVVEWPAWAGGRNPRRYRLSKEIGGLDQGRGSFRFDDQGLPPAP